MEIGIKCGSLRSAVSYRNGKEIKTDYKHTCIRYPKNFIRGKEQPIVGDAAYGYEDTISPLHLGVVESEEGTQQVIDILSTFNIPKNSDLIIISSPAVEITENKRRLVQAIETVASPKDIREFSEGLCSAIYILKDPSKILSSTFFSLNLGSSTTEFACISEGEIIHLSAHGEVCGNSVDEAIGNNIRNSVSGAMFSQGDICTIKEAHSVSVPREVTIRGTTRKGFIEVPVFNEITTAIDSYVENVTNLVQSEILNSSKITPAIRKKALEMPLIVSGGMSNMTGLPELLISELNKKINFNFDVKYPENRDGHISPAIGALMLAEEITKEQQG